MLQCLTGVIRAFSISILPFHGKREENQNWGWKLETYFTRQHPVLKGPDPIPVWAISGPFQTQAKIKQTC